MKRFRHPLVALILSLLLLASQQASFAHVLSHLHLGSAAATHFQNEHDDSDGLADTCLTCVAFAGVVGSTPTSAIHFAVPLIPGDSYVLSASKPYFARSVITRRARAPPVSL